MGNQTGGIIYSTFEGWLEQGRVVVRGQKAKCFNEHGVALFSKDQTKDHMAKQYSDRMRIYEYRQDYYNEVYEAPFTEHPIVTEYADGSSTVNFGGPCGPMYFDRDGNQ